MASRSRKRGRAQNEPSEAATSAAAPEDVADVEMRPPIACRQKRNALADKPSQDVIEVQSSATDDDVMEVEGLEDGRDGPPPAAQSSPPEPPTDDKPPARGRGKKAGAKRKKDGKAAAS